jgi:hypothetical protein
MFFSSIGGRDFLVLMFFSSIGGRDFLGRVFSVRLADVIFWDAFFQFDWRT